MALPKTTAAYEDCYEHFDRARASAKGIRVLFKSESQARHFQFRMCQARSLERKDSTRIYDKTDPRWGKTENDKFRVAVRQAAEGDSWWVYIETWNQEVETVEEL